MSPSIALFLTALAGAGAVSASAPKAADLRSSYARLPMHFELNQGQAPQGVRALARGAGYSVLLSDDGVALRLAGSPDGSPLRLRWVGDGAASRPAISAEERLPGRSNYYRGSRQDGWVEGLARYGRVRYEDVYPGIDVVFYGNQRQLEFDFELEAGADPASIRLALDGADRVELDAEGALQVERLGRRLVQHRPVAYQEVDGQRRLVEARYELRGSEVRLAVGSHDATRPLVIDPVLSYSTYLGGDWIDEITTVAVAPDGTMVVAGTTESTDFPTANAQQGTPPGSRDYFVTAFAPGGGSLAYSTYLGGSAEEGFEVALTLDGAGNAYLAGSTDSSDYPTVGAFQGDQAGTDAVISKLSPSGSLLYSTYLGGSGNEVARAIALSKTGDIVVAGWTSSANFPLAAAYQPVLGAGGDAFVTRLNPAGAALVNSTFLGGNALDVATSVAVSPTDSLVVGGFTDSTNFPLAAAIQGNQPGLDDFVSELSGSSLLFSTYLGGGSDEEVRSVSVDGAGGVYVAGVTSSSDFPLLSALFPAQGGTDLTLSKLSAPPRALVYSTYLGGNGSESRGFGAVARDGSFCMVGDTNDSDFPSVSPLQSCHAEGDAVVACLAPNGSRLTFASCLGGSGLERALAIAAGVDGALYLAGSTDSTDFPTVNPYQANQPVMDGYLARVQRYVKGDQNRDGRTDLLLHNNVTGVNELWTMNGTTRVASVPLSPPAAASLDWQVAGLDDFNGDDQGDLLFWNAATGASEFWLMNGTTRVGSPQPLAGALPLPWKPSATADFDGDGRPDVVWRNGANCGGGDPDCQRLRIWLMNGTTKASELTPKPAAAVDGNWEIVGAADLDADTSTDFLWYNNSSGKIVYWAMQYSSSAAACSAQGLAAPCVYRTAGGFTNPANAGDANWKVLALGDYGVGTGGQPGTKDLVWRNANSGRFVVWHMDDAYGRTSGLFTTPNQPDTNPTDWTVAGPR